MHRDQRKLSRSPANQPAANQPRLWNIINSVGAVPVLELFGDIGTSKEGDPWWGIEGGAGTFQEFANDLKKIGNVPELRVEIHSYGGSVVVGKGIHDKLLEHPANKTAVIYGICASAATYAALACQKVQIPANSFFLIHNSTGMCFGTAEDMQRCADMLIVADESIAALYAARTGKSLKEIQDIMDRDTWMSGTEAVAIGLADEAIDPITIDPATRATPDNFRPALMNSMPSSARAWFDMSRQSPPANTAPYHVMPPTTPPAPVAAPAVNGNEPPAAPAAPVEPPVAPAAPVVAPAPVAAPANVVTQPPVAPAAAPDIATLITNAVNVAVKPLQDEVSRLTALNNAGISPQTLGGAQPVANVASPEAPAEPATPRLRAVNALTKLPVFGGK